MVAKLVVVAFKFKLVAQYRVQIHIGYKYVFKLLEYCSSIGERRTMKVILKFAAFKLI